MRTELAKSMGLEAPIFAFTRSPQVVVEVEVVRLPARAARPDPVDAHPEPVEPDEPVGHEPAEVLHRELGREPEHAGDGHRVGRALHPQPGRVGRGDGERAGRVHGRGGGAGLTYRAAGGVPRGTAVAARRRGGEEMRGAIGRGLLS